MTGIEGGCLCGAVRYRIESGTPLSSAVCHCHTCRRITGAPAVAWAEFPRAGFAFTAGQPRGFQSSAAVVRTFCDRCGSALTYANAHTGDRIEVTTATLDHPETMVPDREVWLEHRLPWQPVNSALRAYSRGSDG